MAARYPGLPLWAAGFSFGAWVALETGAADDRVTVLIGIAPPVVTSVSGMNYTFPNTLASRKPKFFVQGEADEVCPLEGMWQFYGQLPEPKELVVIDGADHCSRERRRKSAKRSRICWATSTAEPGSESHHAGRSHRFGGADSRRQGAERALLRFTRPDEMARGRSSARR